MDQMDWENVLCTLVAMQQFKKRHMVTRLRNCPKIPKYLLLNDLAYLGQFSIVARTQIIVITIYLKNLCRVISMGITKIKVPFIFLNTEEIL